MNSKHSDLNASEVKYIELSDAELEMIAGGKDKGGGCKPTVGPGDPATGDGIRGGIQCS